MSAAKTFKYFRTPVTPRHRVRLACDGPSRAKQSFKDECDVNQIVASFQKTGLITHVAKHAPRYGYASSLQFRESIELIRQGREMFAELPSSTRKEFDNNVEDFLDWAQDPDNADRLDAIGKLATPSEVKEPGPVDRPLKTAEKPSPAATEPEAAKQ